MNADAPAAIEVPCPQCGEVQAVTPVSVLRSHEKTVGLLFKGALNRFACEHCGATITVDVPLLYRDDRRRLIVYFVPPGASGPVPEKQAEEQIEAVMQAVFGAAADERTRPECRLALLKAEFIEKIALFRAHLDDRLVEFIKYQLYSRHPRELDPTRVELLYDFSNAAKDRLGFIIFNRETARAESGIHVPMDVYRELAATFHNSADLQDELRKLFPGHIVCAANLF